MSLIKNKCFKNFEIASFLIIISCTFLLPFIQCDNSNSGYYHNQSRQKGFLESIAPRVFTNAPVVDPDVVYNGVVDPNNIAIHVMQNFVNFAAGSVAWFLLSFTFQERTKRSTSRNFPQAPIPLTIKAPPPNSFGTEDFLNQYYSNYGQQSSLDSTFTRSERISRSTDYQTNEKDGNTESKTTNNQISSSKHLANMFRSLADAADSLDRYVLCFASNF